MGRKLLCICYQGCSHGPFSKYENNWEYVSYQLNAIHEICVDVWCTNGKWFTGETHPQYPIERGYIIEWPDYMWYNCKDDESLRELVALEEQRCFRERREGETELTVASGDDKGREIKFPGQRCTEKCLCFLPEQNPRLDNWYACHCLVTRFADYYERIFSYQLTLHETIVDDLLASDKADDRRALGLYTLVDNTNFEQAPELSLDAMMDDLRTTFKDQNIFEIDDPKNVLHHLFMQIIGYEQFSKQFSSFEKLYKQYDKIFQEELNVVLPYKIVMRGLIATKSGIWIMGYPSIDINVWRLRIERKLQRRGLVYMRSVAKTAHWDVMRINSASVTVDQLKAFCAKYEHTYFGDMTVDALTLGLTSVRMQTRERRHLKTYTVPEEGGYTLENTDRQTHVVDDRRGMKPDEQYLNQYDKRVGTVTLKEGL